MNELTKPTKTEPTKPIADHKQRGMSVIELLFAASTIVAGVVTAALTTVKKPPGYGD